MDTHTLWTPEIARKASMHSLTQSIVFQFQADVNDQNGMNKSLIQNECQACIYYEQIL